MSYLELPDGIPSFSKAVISVWFRVPQASIDAKKTDGDAADPASLLRYIIPLITFATPLTMHEAETVFTNVAVPINFSATPPPVILSPTSFTVTGELPLDPSHIGFHCVSKCLIFNIQLPGRAILTHIGDQISRIDLYSSFGTPPYPPIGYDPAPGTGWGGSGLSIEHTVGIVDVSDSNNFRPEYFHVDTSHVLEPDHWHHLLLSLDLSAPCTTHGPPQTNDPHGSTHETTDEGTISSCRLWYAIDDTDYNGAENLGPYFVDGGADPNAILTDNAWHIANDVTGLIGNLWSTPSTCDYTPEPIPTSHAKMGTPASTTYVDQIYSVELAELQIFTGVTIHTGIESNRRAFITATMPDPADSTKQIGGTPVPPIPPMIDNPAYDPSIPESATNPKQIPDPDGSPAEKLLGKKPDILLHGSGNWTIGKNTGPMIDNPDYDPTKPISADNPLAIPDPDKQFTPTGKIVAYTPDPSLHGPQSPDTPPPLVRLQRRIRVAA